MGKGAIIFFSYLCKNPITMIALLISFLLLLQTQQPGPGFDEYRLPKDGSTMQNTPYGFEAAEAGWGSSIWDKGHYYPGMDVEAVRAFYRKEFFKNLAIILAGIIAAAGIGYGIYILIRNHKKKNKESSKELLIYYKSTKPHHSDRTESSGQDQGSCQPS